MINLDPFLPFLPKPNPEPTPPERKVQEVQKTQPTAKADAHPDAVAETEDRQQKRRERPERRKKKRKGQTMHYYDRRGHNLDQEDQGSPDVDLFA